MSELGVGFSAVAVGSWSMPEEPEAEPEGDETQPPEQG